MSADLNLTVKKLPRSFLTEEINFNKWASYFVKLSDVMNHTMLSAL